MEDMNLRILIMILRGERRRLYIGSSLRPILADIIIYKCGFIKFCRRHAEDTRPYFKSTIDTFSQWFNTFLHFKIYESVKTRSAFEKYLKCLGNGIFASFFIVLLKGTAQMMKNDLYSLL